VKPTSGIALGVLEKIHDAHTGAAIFFCVGARGEITRVTTEYLVRHWRALRREFGDEPFAICLGFPEPASYYYEYGEPKRLNTLSGQ
jgi:hypothetical protein